MGETMADLIDRLYPEAERGPDDVRADLPELARALLRTGRLLHRRPGAAPAIYWATEGHDGGSPEVHRAEYLSAVVDRGPGGPAYGDDAAESRRLNARVAAEVPIPEPGS